jgi:hypothetical protein
MPALKLSSILRSAFTKRGTKPFDKLLLVLSEAFNGEPKLRALPLNKRGCFTWPKSPGVYVIRERGKGAVLYIGAVGHIRAERKNPSSGTFRQRAGRWTPYCFDNKQKMFRFDPKGRGAKCKRDQLTVGYVGNIKFTKLEVFCFTIGANDHIAPAAVEALLLQMHLEQHRRLPRANRQF